jgi:hypothetical protein
MKAGAPPVEICKERVSKLLLAVYIVSVLQQYAKHEVRMPL